MSFPIKAVMIYSGHTSAEVLGPYFENIAKRVEMFVSLNAFRKKIGGEPWQVKKASGEELIRALSSENPQETLLVIPAGQSTHLDKVFTTAQITFLKEEFFQKGGGRVYVNCGSAYWSSKERIYDDLSLEQPEKPKRIRKTSMLPLFEGTAIGPLCRFPAIKYKVGFFSDAVKVTNGSDLCTIFLSGGGSFILPEKSGQKLRVLLRYPRKELERHQKKGEELKAWENAAILTSVGKGAALMSMFHPYYGPQDIDTVRYERAFPDSGTNWREIHERLTPTDQRMHFVMKSMLLPLEDFAFDSETKF
ncbi:MAG: hypothetical protein KR126chlam3_00440 [Chlamydiae bacterium]|nr:hypothetical protein [Chlamydiota bacterium]